MPWYRSEPTLGEMLSDPIVRALMAADGVSPEELRANLSNIAGRREQHRGRDASWLGLPQPSAAALMERGSDCGSSA